MAELLRLWRCSFIHEAAVLLEELANVNFVELKADCLCNLTKKELHLVNFLDDIFIT